jgi:FdhD/NarQ family
VIVFAREEEGLDLPAADQAAPRDRPITGTFPGRGRRGICVIEIILRKVSGNTAAELRGSCSPSRPDAPPASIAARRHKCNLGVSSKRCLTSEMVIKIVRMEIPILISRNGFTAWGVDLARKANLTLIDRAKGSRFTASSCADRIIFDTKSVAFAEAGQAQAAGVTSDA